MSRNYDTEDGRPVPFRRLSRLAGFGGMAANIAGGMALNSAKQFASGKRPSVSDLFMTPSNALKVTDKLANMRGAAMKIGQMISMDSGDFIPKEFASILAKLRSDAQHMPRAQLDKVLRSEWGDDWSSQFANFEHHPIAAASIGQVHRASTHSGETLAIKVQYPGVRDSIDSDVKNVASLLRLSGLIPSELDVKPLIEEGRKQLHQEADYERESAYLCRFAELLSDDANFEVPQYYPELSTDKILAMSYIEGKPIEAMVDAPQATRDRLVRLLMDLVLQELFVFSVMQTDPNFANYRYNEQEERLVLLDFGASRDIDDTLAASYRELMQTVLSGNREACFNAVIKMGFIPTNVSARYLSALLDIVEMVMEPLSKDASFDFGDNRIALQIRDKAMELAANRELWHLPPANTVFIQRKLGGIYMLATQLRAKVNVHALMQEYVGEKQ
jgi:predicted unusual protein kinase regulating ubiquinone biosynthesis (AarF/ABC1/UbiB family)